MVSSFFVAPDFLNSSLTRLTDFNKGVKPAIPLYKIYIKTRFLTGVNGSVCSVYSVCPVIIAARELSSSLILPYPSLYYLVIILLIFYRILSSYAS
jgi:hypothetical protein